MSFKSIIAVAALTTVTLTSGAFAANFDPAYTSRDIAIQELANSVTSSGQTSTAGIGYDPSVDSRDLELERLNAAAASNRSAIATNDAPSAVAVGTVYDPAYTSRDRELEALSNSLR